MICLFFTVMGYHFIFRMRISEAKKEMRSRLLARNSPEITQFDLSLDKMEDLEWENSNEFRLNGQMYDVIEMKTSNGLVTLKCIPDHKETALVEQYIKTNQTPNSEKQPWVALLQLASAPFIVPSMTTPFPFVEVIGRCYAVFRAKLFSRAFPIPTPPPRLC